MNKYCRLLFIFLLCISFMKVYPGNPNKAGQAGATELLINPWARSSGWHGAFSAGVSGVEAMRFNPGGILSIDNTEFIFSRTVWLSGTDIFINSFGLVQKLGAEKMGALGLSIMSFDFGDIEITTEDHPSGGIGTFSPQFVNIGITYGHQFSDRIKTGLTVRIISESIPDASARGVALDAGLQYVTDIGGDEDKKRTRFGISLRNVGLPMKYEGDGLSRRATIQGSDITMSMDGKSALFELPTLINIAFAQDFYLDSREIHKLTTAFSFISNSFSNDQFHFGLQYGLKNIILLRGGLLVESDIFKDENTMNIHKGPAGGFSVNIPLGKDKDKKLGVDYSFRATQHFKGTHCFGARLIL